MVNALAGHLGELQAPDCRRGPADRQRFDGRPSAPAIAAHGDFSSGRGRSASSPDAQRPLSGANRRAPVNSMPVSTAVRASRPREVAASEMIRPPRANRAPAPMQTARRTAASSLLAGQFVRAKRWAQLRDPLKRTSTCSINTKRSHYVNNTLALAGDFPQPQSAETDGTSSTANHEQTRERGSESPTPSGGAQDAIFVAPLRRRWKNRPIGYPFRISPDDAAPSTRMDP